MGGGGDVEEKSSTLGLPIELIQESENHRHDDEGIFPDNEQIVDVFKAVVTQWRVGPGGAYGLDYNVFDRAFRRHKVKSEDEDDVFDGLQIMERAALKVLREKAEE